jgi:hypothetical protein
MEPPRSDHIPLIPSPDGAPDLRVAEEAVRRWVDEPMFSALTARFDWPLTSGDVGERLARLDELSEAWNFRGGRERNLAAAAALDEDTERSVLACARRLGLRDAFGRPERDRYEHCLILGGLVRACVLRPALAADLVRSGVSFGEITALGAFRPLAGDEPVLAEQASLSDVTDEIWAMDAGVRRALALGEPVSVAGELADDASFRSWTVRRYDATDAAVSVIAAPSGDPARRRATTPETYAWWAENVAELQAGQRVLIVTSAIYAPYQHADAVRMLAVEYGCGVETVGVPHYVTGGMDPQPFGAQHYLQEMRSTIRAFRALITRLRSGPGQP